MKKLLLIAAAVLAGATGLRAQEYTAISPDGKITVTVSTAPELRWSVTREGERLLDASRIGMKIAGAEPFGAASRRRYVVSFGREPERRGASDARCGSRDQCLFFHKVGL